MGSTGDPPVPVGDSPTGRSRRPLPQDPSFLGLGAIPVPCGGSSDEGQWPVLSKSESVSASGAVGYQMSHGETFETSPVSTIPHPLEPVLKLRGALRRGILAVAKATSSAHPRSGL